MQNQFTKVFYSKLNTLEDFIISFPNLGEISVIESLKKLPRTGKLIRFKRFDKSIRVRTIYDHIFTLYKNTLVFMNYNIFELDYDRISSLIVYHDICECIIGDFPAYTNYDFAYKYKNNIKQIDKETREEYANNILFLFANDNQRKEIAYLSKKDDIHELFLILDCIDPIINIWRYMHKFKEIISDRKFEFVEIMRDFFTNPILGNIIKENKYPLISKLLYVLKNQDNAIKYLDGKCFFEISDEDISLLLNDLIEKVSPFA